MRIKKALSLRVTVSTLLIALLIQNATVVNAGSLLCSDKLAQAAVPQDAFYLPVNKALQLGSALNEHGVVRLDPNGDYTRAFPIKMKSNQALYGLAGTKVPDIVISAGAENVIVSDIHNGKIVFPASDLVTSRNCFNRIRTSIEIKHAKLENNLFTDFQGGIINIDNSKRGYIRNNRFIKTMTHTAWPALTILGNSTEPSYGNHFVWTNILGPMGDSIIIDQQKNITFTGIDIESWQMKAPMDYPAAINVSNTDFLSIFMPHGGNLRIESAQYFNLDAKKIFLMGSFVKTQSMPGLILGKHVQELLAINTLEIGHKAENAETKVTELFKNNEPKLFDNWKIAENNQLSSLSRPAINEILRQEKVVYKNWEKPKFLKIPNPLGPNSQNILKVYENASESIQSLIDRQNIAKLEPGIYYLSKSIELKDGQGIVGAGQDKTILVANSSDMDLIVGANHINHELKSTWFVLADLTLQGGRNGIHHDTEGSGGGAQYHRSVLSHITFRNMSNAAIFLDSIYAWDNNFLDNINFINCGTAIMQRPNTLYKGGDVPGTTYMDKNVCYRCQFEHNTIALDMPGKRGNGLNAFIDSQFKNNGKVISAIHPLSNFFANSIFIDNQGNPAFETNKSLGFVHTDFTQTIAGSLFQRYTLCNGCSFDIRQLDASILTDRKDQKAELNFFINSKVGLSVSKRMHSGLILDSSNNDPAEMLGLFINNNKTTPLFTLQEGR
ncbi:hypothetical protein SCD_n01338 [Sulfuricella denitrificans skB26]|uniref:Right handed beta helix domain-containing protein n=2 Tax=Sulfuricella denitrificans TaxID=649841 RepID=S6AA34_SULDS|nr:hypothetical protein SCD_n01338 [Sulfuricella denitrificans skB26]